MEPSLIIVIAWTLFGGSHLVMSGSGLRSYMTARFGPLSFTLLFVATTIVTLSLLLISLYQFGDKGASGVVIESTAVRAALRAGSFVGAFLLLAGLASFPISPMSVLAQRGGHSNRKLSDPSGVALITRHPFFVGLALLSASHVFLASTLANAVFFGGLFALCLLGIPMQDHKLKRRWGAVYEDYISQTSVIPFAKLAPRVTFKDLITWAGGSIVAGTLFVGLHSFWSFGNGAVFVGFIMLYGTLGAALGILRRLKQAKRHGTDITN